MNGPSDTADNYGLTSFPSAADRFTLGTTSDSCLSNHAAAKTRRSGGMDLQGLSTPSRRPARVLAPAHESAERKLLETLHTAGSRRQAHNTLKRATLRADEAWPSPATHECGSVDSITSSLRWRCANRDIVVETVRVRGFCVGIRNTRVSRGQSIVQWMKHSLMTRSMRRRDADR